MYKVHLSILSSIIFTRCDGRLFEHDKTALFIVRSHVRLVSVTLLGAQKNFQLLVLVFNFTIGRPQFRVISVETRLVLAPESFPFPRPLERKTSQRRFVLPTILPTSHVPYTAVVIRERCVFRPCARTNEKIASTGEGLPELSGTRINHPVRVFVIRRG